MDPHPCVKSFLHNALQSAQDTYGQLNLKDLLLTALNAAALHSGCSNVRKLLQGHAGTTAAMQAAL